MKIIFMIFSLLPAFTINAQWTLTNCPVGQTETNGISTNDTSVFAASNWWGGNFYSSQNSGQTWNSPFSFSGYIQTVFNSDGYLFVSGSEGNYRSVDGGISSNQMPSLATEAFAYIKFGSYIFAGTYGGGVYRSPDLGDTWSTYNNGLNNYYVLAFAHDTNSIYAATAGGLIKSSNMGGNWLNVTTSIGSPSLTAVTFDGTYIIVGGNYCGLYRSSDSGLTWIAANTGVASTDIRTLYTIGETIFLGCGSGSYYSIDHGATWIDYNYGFPETYYISSYCVIGTTLLCGTYSQGIWQHDLLGPLGTKEISESQLIIYPNPSNGKFLIKSSLKIENILLKDNLGRIIRYFENDYNIDITDLNNGIYFLEFSIDKRKLTEKIIKTNI